jgi:hypothetical protein
VLLVVAVLVGVATVPLARGHLSALGTVRLKLVPLIFAALALQLLLTTVLPGGSELLHRILHLGSYAMIAGFLFANRHITGIAIVAAGTALNLAAIVANGGVMPASRHAMKVAGITPSHDFMNSTALAHPRLLPLGDIFAVPKGWPLHNVYSVGDIVIVIGAVIAIHAICGSHLVRTKTKMPACASPDS